MISTPRGYRELAEADEEWRRLGAAPVTVICSDAVGLTPEQDAQFWDYVTHAAQFMINTMEDVS